MKIRGKKLTVNQKKVLQRKLKLKEEEVNDYLYKSMIILPCDDREHLNPDCDKAEYWNIISKTSGEVTRIFIRVI